MKTLLLRRLQTTLDQELLKGKADLYLGVDNLFDVDYETSYGFPQAGRFIYGGVRVTL